MTIKHFECAAGHVFEIEDTNDQASEIALRQTRKRFDNGGCDVPLSRGVNPQICRSSVTETTRTP